MNLLHGLFGRQLGKTRGRMDCPHCIRSGFTLIELLVVVAIIGVLFAIALPVFGNAGRKDTYRAAQKVATTLRLARQNAVAKRQWTFVIFPNRDGIYTTDPNALNNIKKCLRSYAVIAVTNDVRLTETSVVNGVMQFEFVSDWKYLPEGIYFDDTSPVDLQNNYVFGTKPNSAGYDASAAQQFKFPYDPADPNNSSKQMIMSAVLFRPTGHFHLMCQGQKDKWQDKAFMRLYLTSSHYYEFDGDSSLADAVVIPGTNSMLEFQGKTGMVKIFDGESANK